MSELLIRRVLDDSDLRQWNEITEASLVADFDALPADPDEAIRPALSGYLGGEPIELWLGALDDVPVTAATVKWPDRDNLELALISLNVHPALRSNGCGRAAMTTALARVNELGRSRVLFEVPTRTKTHDPAPGEAFARSLGARPLITEMRRVLTVDEVDLRNFADDVAGYSLLRWRDVTPPELIDDMAVMLAMMSSDPPQGELDLNPEIWDGARFIEWEQSFVDRGRAHLYVAARHDETGRLAGFTDIALHPGQSVGGQGATIVGREHRGHRLGLALKVANLKYLREQLPAVKYLNTWNADENTHMLAVNEQLGYRPMEGWAEWGLTV